MEVRVIFLFLLIVFSANVRSQKIDNLASFRDMKSEHYFRFNYENDFFSATDKNYTQGYNLELVAPGLQQNPLNYLFFNTKKTENRYGISIEHIGFTPSDFVSSEIQNGDRPFAAAIMLKSFTIATDTLRVRRVAQSFSLGIIGPGAFGKEMQVEIHKATGNKIPGGWDNQIKNDLVLNYRLDYEKQLYRYNDLFSLNSNTTLQVGTLFTKVSLGVNTSLGLLSSAFTPKKKKDKFQVYLYSQPVLSVVGYDATLQGGLFNKDSPYTLKASEVERLTAQLNYGLVLKTRTLYFEYARTSITKEFKSGSSANWGGIKVGFTF
ncbi:MAG: lipid A deacylase LpxR family protein [Maribacter sp.]